MLPNSCENDGSPEVDPRDSARHARRVAMHLRRAANAFVAFADSLVANGAIPREPDQRSQPSTAATERFSMEQKVAICEEIAVALLALLNSDNALLVEEDGERFVKRASTTELFDACVEAANELGIDFRFRSAQHFGKWIPVALDTIGGVGIQIHQGRDKDKKKTWSACRTRKTFAHGIDVDVLLSPTGSPTPRPAPAPTAAANEDDDVPRFVDYSHF